MFKRFGMKFSDKLKYVQNYTITSQATWQFTNLTFNQSRCVRMKCDAIHSKYVYITNQGNMPTFEQIRPSSLPISSTPTRKISTKAGLNSFENNANKNWMYWVHPLTRYFFTMGPSAANLRMRQYYVNVMSCSWEESVYCKSLKSTITISARQCLIQNSDCHSLIVTYNVFLKFSSGIMVQRNNLHLTMEH